MVPQWLLLLLPKRWANGIGAETIIVDPGPVKCPGTVDIIRIGPGTVSVLRVGPGTATVLRVGPATVDVTRKGC